MTRRTPALTNQARDLYEREYMERRLVWAETIQMIADTIGLTADQVRDAVFGESADEWRQGFYSRRAKERADAIHQR